MKMAKVNSHLIHKKMNTIIQRPLCRMSIGKNKILNEMEILKRGGTNKKTGNYFSAYFNYTKNKYNISKSDPLHQIYIFLFL